MNTVRIFAVLLATAVPLTAFAGFEHGIVIDVDGEDYYLAGAPDGVDGAVDVPGHYWNQAGSYKLVGKHYNTGPFGAASWWSSDAGDGALLFVVKGVIDVWTEDGAEDYAAAGYTHYHELLAVDDGDLHPDYVVWLKHIAVDTFEFDGGPLPLLGHSVKPGLDRDFMVNYSTPYDPETGH